MKEEGFHSLAGCDHLHRYASSRPQQGQLPETFCFFDVLLMWTAVE
jgi:hypothetical protein